MPESGDTAARLPERPSREYLRKVAKRLARDRKLILARAQAELARSYGYRSWAELMKAVDAAAAPAAAMSPLSAAASRADVAEVRRLLDSGAPVDGAPPDRFTPLFHACDSAAPTDRRLETARLLIDAGAFTRPFCEGGLTPLHAAARRGPIELVELLLRHGAILWVEDEQKRRPFDHARDGDPIDRDQILFLLADGPKIADPLFRAAVEAIHSGDLDGLARILDERPSLLHERAIEPDTVPRGYFSDPKLFWFVANNPTLVPRPPANIAEIARMMIARGVGQEDLDYTLELVMTDALMPRDLQIDLVRTLVEAGAAATRRSILMTLGHRQVRPIEWLVGNGLALDAAMAAGLGRTTELPQLLASASSEETSDALGMAIINRQVEAARLCLEAGADPNRFMPCHSHSTPLHQAALDGDVEMLKLLVGHGARLDIRDTLWRGTPLGWAIHGERKEAEAYLRSLA